MESVANTGVISNFAAPLQPATNTPAMVPVTPLPELLNKISKTISRFVSLPHGGADTVALYTCFTHTVAKHEHCPRMLLWSPLAGSGKSTLESLLSHLCFKADALSNVSEAYIYAALNDKEGCTLILDELDTYMGGAKATLTGILNSGHARDTAHVGRMQKNEIGQFDRIKYSTFNPIVFASKDKNLPEAIGQPLDQDRTDQARGRQAGRCREVSVVEALGRI